MASQISHIVYAKTLFEGIDKRGAANGFGKINKDEFLLGCVFPDIRRVDENINRRDTHFKFVNLNLNFSGLTSFEAGWKFHLYCDMKREEILNELGFYELPNSTELFGQPAKILEDELLYDKYNNWEKLSHYFNRPPFVVSGIDVKKESFDLWYAIIARYIERKPEDQSIRSFLVKQRSLVNKVDDLMEKIRLLRKDGQALEILGKACQEIVKF